MASGATQLSELKQVKLSATLGASVAETCVLTTAERFNSVPGAFGVANCRIVGKQEVSRPRLVVEDPLIRIDRHRGSGCPLTPATPPYVRVRIRRFEKLRRYWSTSEGRPSDLK